MADKATKVKIVSWCLMIALCVFAGALSLYFFVFNRAPNERGHEIYADLNEVLTSKEQQEVDVGLGTSIIDNKHAQDYATSQASNDLGPKFHVLYLCYCMDRELVDTYQFEAAFLSNADYKMSVKLANAVKDYKTALANVQNYLKLFNQSYVKANGATSDETYNNFSYMLNNFDALVKANHTLAIGIIEYVDKIYYGFEENLNKYCTEKFVLSYALSCESKTVYTNREQLYTRTVATHPTFLDAKAQLTAYVSSKQNGFNEQISNQQMLNLLNIMINNGKAYKAFFESGNKKAFIEAADTDLKPKLIDVAKGLGLGGRIGQ